MNVGILEAWLKLRDDLTPALQAIGPSLDKLEQNLSKAGGALLPLSAAIALVGGASLKFASDFNSAMTESMAILPEMSESLRRDLGDTAREVALTTTQSAEDAAKGYYFLASAGITTAEALRTALPLAAQFAQAGVMGMADATEILVDSVKSLGLSVDRDMGRVGDVIVKAAVASSASVQQMGDALTNKAAIAMRTFGISVEEGAAVLSVFADQGVKGQIAGERYAILLNGLGEAFGKNTEAFKKYNVELFDSEGSMRNVGDVTKDFEKALEGLSDKQKIAVLDQMGLTRETKAAVLQLMGASSEIKRYEEAYKSAGGTMKSIADNQMKSFANQVDLAKKAVVDAAISIGDSLRPSLALLLPLIKDGAAFVKTLAERFSEFSTPTKTLVLGIVALVGALGPMLLAVASAVGAWGALTPLLTAAGTTFGALATFTGLAGASLLALGLLVVAAITYWDDLTDAVNVFTYTPIGEFISDLISLMGDTFVGIVRTVTETIKFLTFGFVDLETGIRNASTFFDAVNLSWLALKFTAIQLGIALLSAKSMLMFDGDPMKAEVQKNIDALKQLQLTYSDTAAGIVSGSKTSVAGVKEVGAALTGAQNPLNETKRRVVDLGLSHKETEAAQKKHAKAMEDAEKDAAKYRVELIKLKETQDAIAFSTGFADLPKIMGDAAKEAKVLADTTLPLPVQVMNAAIAAKQNQIDTKAWNDEVDKLGKTLKLPKEELDKLKKSTEENKQATFDWKASLDTVKDVFQILGVSADNFLMKTITAFQGASAITDQMNESLKKAGTSAKDFFNMEGAQQAQVAMAGLNTAMIAYKSGALGGAAAGATFGSSFGPIGTAIGGAVGGLLGWIGGNKKAQEEARKLSEDLEKQRRAFIDSSGGLTVLETRAREAGLTLDNLFKAKTVKEYDDAVKELNRQFELQKEATDGVKAAMDRYGLTILDMGPKWQQQEMDKKFGDLFRDYSLLIGAGVENNTVISKMGPELNGYVQTAIAAGTTIPESMRPVLEQMLKMGLLTDEAGEKLTSLEGLTFAESLTESVKSIVDAVRELVNALLGVPNITRTITINTVQGSNGGGPDGGSGPGGAAQGEALTYNPNMNQTPGFYLPAPLNPVRNNIPTWVQPWVPPGYSGYTPPQTAGGASSANPMYFVINPTDNTVEQIPASEFRKLQTMLNSGGVTVPARIVSQRAS